jgi:hypothetical protein
MPNELVSEASLGSGTDIRLRLAGVKPNSDAMRIMSSACLFTPGMDPPVFDVI